MSKIFGYLKKGHGAERKRRLNEAMAKAGRGNLFIFIVGKLWRFSRILGGGFCCDQNRTCWVFTVLSEEVFAMFSGVNAWGHAGSGADSAVCCCSRAGANCRWMAEVRRRFLHFRRGSRRSGEKRASILTCPRSAQSTVPRLIADGRMGKAWASQRETLPAWNAC
jgi:hypothetical protein